MAINWDPAKPWVARQPFKLVYTVYFILRSAVSIPAWAVLYVLPIFRPVSSWPYKTALLNKIFYYLLHYYARTRQQTIQPLTADKEKDLFVALNPAPAGDFKKIYAGLLDNPHIQPTTVGGFWLPSLKQAATASSAATDSWVILHFHGGGYVLMTPRDPATQRGPRQLCEELSASGALCVDYRLSSNPNSSHPAQLQDALTAYNYLTQHLGIPSRRILFSGDSAGAHLAILLLRHLLNHPESDLPLPRALLLHSPWLDLTPAATAVDKLPGGRDYLCDSFLEWGASTFTPAGAPRDSDFVSPVYYPFHSPVPIWVQAGGVEKLYATIAEWVIKMRNAGSLIELYTMEGLPHDVFHFSTDMGLEVEAREALRDARRFLDHTQ